MIAADKQAWVGETTVITQLRNAYRGLVTDRVPAELSRVAGQLEEPGVRADPAARLAVVAEADPERRSLAKALLEESDLGVVECASAEAALAVLVKEAGKTVFVLADRELAGERDAEALATTVRMLWPGIHMAVAGDDIDAPRRTDEAGIVRLSRPWRGLDVLIEAERARARAA